MRAGSVFNASDTLSSLIVLIIFVAMVERCLMASQTVFAGCDQRKLLSPQTPKHQPSSIRRIPTSCYKRTWRMSAKCSVTRQQWQTLETSPLLLHSDGRELSRETSSAVQLLPHRSIRAASMDTFP